MQGKRIQQQRLMQTWRGWRLILFCLKRITEPVLFLLGMGVFLLPLQAASYRAARSVHLRWRGPEAVCFYNQVRVLESVPGSYFMVCGWDTGYFGIQQLGPGQGKIVLFSVWDTFRGNNPSAVPPDRRAEVLYAAPDVQIRRFGGEGTGVQCKWPYEWKKGQLYRFCVQATVDGKRTAYTAYFYIPEKKKWKRLATFRTYTGGHFLRGFYSFIEDFRRNGKSVHQTRRAEFGPGWIRSKNGKWKPLIWAQFTASNAPWESKENIFADIGPHGFLLATGGEIRSPIPLGSWLQLPQRLIPKTAPSDIIPLSMLRGYFLPTIDLAPERQHQVVVDYEPGQYLGHPSMCLLEDGRTLLCVYPKGHGRGAIVYKRSTDGGRTWSPRLPTPKSWATSKETPTIHRVVGPDGKRRLILWSGLYPARLAISEDDGRTWSELQPVGKWGGIVVMGSVVPLRTGRGHYLAMFHDDGRFFQATPHVQKPPVMTLYETFSVDGGLTWTFPKAIWSSSRIHLCEPGVIRSPDGKTLAVLLRENRRVANSYVMFSKDEGQTWSTPRELPGALTGDRHIARYLPDGRLIVVFRDMAWDSPTRGDWVAWVGTFEDIQEGREGQYRIRLMDNHHSWDCGYSGLEILPDGTIVAVSYGHWVENQPPFIVCVRFRIEEIDQKARQPLPPIQSVDHSDLIRRFLTPSRKTNASG